MNPVKYVTQSRGSNMKNQSPMAFLVDAVIILFLIFSAISTPVFSTIIGGPVVNSTNGHTYYLLDDTTWTASENEAISLDGHLVTINNEEENVWVAQTFGHFGGGNYPLLWIGLNDAAVEGTFVWASGEQPTYTNWHSGEPNGAFPSEDYAHITIAYGNGEWVDRRDEDGNKLYGVVELPFTDAIKSRFNDIRIQFVLYQNHPNPFNPSTTISFDLPRASEVTLKIFDLVGHEVATLAEQKMQAGRYNFKWDASGLPGGVYFYRLQTEAFTQTRKLLLLR